MSRLRGASGAGLSDLGALAIAISAWAGALVGIPIARPFGLLALGSAWHFRRAGALCVGVFVLAGTMAHASTAAPEPVATGDIEAAARVLTDPVRIARGVRLDADIDGRRYELVAWGPAGARLRDRLVGESVTIEGSVRPVRPETWAGRRGVVGSVSVAEVLGHVSASGHERLANEFRRLLTRGSTSLATDDQALFLGVVFGDDRNLGVLVDDDFRAAGLTHLVAVSGQNVAFVLLVFGPLLRRFGPWGRWALVLGVLLLFGTVTRFEPSVVRATAMAGVAATATALGREASATRTLSLAVAGLVLFDPGLVHSLGFRLSVAATAGILWVAPSIASWLRGPRPLREALGVTLGAQLAVAPMLTITFGGVPTASVPANLLAGPASAPVMIWGLTGGVVAGLAPERISRVLHWPTGLLTGWLRVVARLAAQAPLGRLGPLEVFGGGALVALLVMGRHRRAAGIAAIGLMALPSLVFVAPAPGFYALTSGVDVWRGDTDLVVVGQGGSPRRALPALREAGVADISLVVLATGSDAERATALAIEQRHRVGAVWAPSDLAEGAVVPVGQLLITRTGTDGTPSLVVSDDRAPP